MKFVSKLVVLLLCLSSGNVYSMEESPLEGTERLCQINTRTKESYDEYKNKNSFTIRYLDEAMMLSEHRQKMGNLKTLPKEFVERQIERAQTYTPSEKQPLLEYILSDLNLSDKESIDRVEYNCASARIMALASLKPEEILIHGKSDSIDFLKAPRINPRLPMGDDVMILMDYFRSVRSEILNKPDEKNICFLNMLCHLNFEDLKFFSTPPYNYSFLRALSPKKGVSIVDRNPFFGTQTVPYSIFNDFYLLGAALSPKVAPHNYVETQGPFGFWWHDLNHLDHWKNARDSLKSSSLYEIMMDAFIDIYMVALREPNKKERKKIFDFLFINMHESLPAEYLIGKFENKTKPLTKHDIYIALESFEWVISHKHNLSLGTLIASNGFPETIIEDEKTKSEEILKDEFKKAINRFRVAMFQKLHDVYKLY